MNVRTVSCLVCLGLALLALGPASAMGSEWKHKGVSLKEPIEIGLTGTETVKTLSGEQKCEFHATIATEGGSTAKFTKFAVNASSCTGTGIFACSVILTESTALPWKIDLQERDLTVTTIQIYKTYSPLCLIESTESTTGSATITLTEASAIRAGQIDWLPQTDINGEPSGTVEAASSFKVDEPNAGTYGIG
jgi:hypothetical protein